MLAGFVLQIAFRLATLGALALLAACGTGGPAVLEDVGSTTAVILDEQAAASAISLYRAKHGLGPVVIDANLIRAASLQAAANAKAGRLSHDLGGSFEARMARFGLGRSFTAENLSAGSETFDQVLGRWQASPQHNGNMLIPQMTRVGIARVDAPQTRLKRYWALVLAGER